MARYEVSDEQSCKFWEITLAGRTFTTRWGRIGSRGQSVSKHFDDDGAARKAHDKLVAEKLKKGYRCVSGGDLPPPTNNTGAPAAAMPLRRSPELEAALLAAPDDERILLVYADWLEAAGDPRGELIAMQHALKGEKDAARFLALKQRVDAHLRKHERGLVGALDGLRHLFKLEWHAGFLRAARLSYGAAAPSDPPATTALTRLLDEPIALLLAELSFGNTGGDDAPAPRGGRYDELLALLAARPQPSALRSLFLGDYWPGERNIPEDGPLGDLTPLYPRLPGLRKLIFATGAPTLGVVALPELRHLESRDAVDEPLLASLQASPWPNLEQLGLRVGNADPEAFGELLTQARFPRLRNLRLAGSRYTAALVEQLADSRLTTQLELLDLSDGNLDDDGAAELAVRYGAFRHLRTLHLGQQSVTMRGCQRLRDFANVRIVPPRRYHPTGE